MCNKIDYLCKLIIVFLMSVSMNICEYQVMSANVRKRKTLVVFCVSVALSKKPTHKTFLGRFYISRSQIPLKRSTERI